MSIEATIQRAADGDVILELRHRWVDGTTHLRFDPLERLERLERLAVARFALVTAVSGYPLQRQSKSAMKPKSMWTCW